MNPSREGRLFALALAKPAAESLAQAAATSVQRHP
jgi:hypothetical protein